MSQLVIFAFLACLASMTLSTIVIEPYPGAASVQYLIYDTATRDALVVDPGIARTDVERIHNISLAKNLTIHAFYVTHPHPDHVAASKFVASVFGSPAPPVYVANSTFETDTNFYAVTLVGDNFDFTTVLQTLPADPSTVLSVQTTSGPVVFTAHTTFGPSEANTESMLYSAAVGALFVGDLVFPQGHMYLGVNVNVQRVAAWRSQLGFIANFVTTTSSPATWTLYPGHGSPTTAIAATIQENQEYLDYFLESLCNNDGNVTLIDADLRARFPTYNVGALQFMAFNAATWAAEAASPTGPCATTTTSSGSVVVLAAGVMGALWALVL